MAGTKEQKKKDLEFVQGVSMNVRPGKKEVKLPPGFIKGSLFDFLNGRVIPMHNPRKRGRKPRPFEAQAIQKSAQKLIRHILKATTDDDPLWREPKDQVAKDVRLGRATITRDLRRLEQAQIIIPFKTEKGRAHITGYRVNRALAQAALKVSTWGEIPAQKTDQKTDQKKKGDHVIAGESIIEHPQQGISPDEESDLFDQLGQLPPHFLDPFFSLFDRIENLWSASSFMDRGEFIIGAGALVTGGYLSGREEHSLWSRFLIVTGILVIAHSLLNAGSALKAQQFPSEPRRAYIDAQGRFHSQQYPNKVIL